MDFKIIRFEEGTDYDRDRGMHRSKIAIFLVNGIKHSIRISMKDFDEGNTNKIVAKEAAKIIDVYGRGSKT